MKTLPFGGRLETPRPNARILCLEILAADRARRAARRGAQEAAGQRAPVVETIPEPLDSDFCPDYCREGESS